MCTHLWYNQVWLDSSTRLIVLANLTEYVVGKSYRTVNNGDVSFVIGDITLLLKGCIIVTFVYKWEEVIVTLLIFFLFQIVVQFDDVCAVCEQISVKQTKELEQFVGKFNSLGKDDLAVGLLINSRQVFTDVARYVSCVGCRRR